MEERKRGGGADRRAAAAPSAKLDVQRIRADFPILARSVRGKPLVYLDNAATTQKPRAVLDVIASYYTDLNANQTGIVTGMGPQTQIGPVVTMTARQAEAAAKTAEAPRQHTSSPMAPGIAAASIAETWP